MSHPPSFRMRTLISGKRMPLVIEPKNTDEPLSAVMAMNISKVENLLTEHGALLFRGFRVKTISDFEEAIDSFAKEKMDYTYRSTPRRSIGKSTYTSTEYPPSEEIPLHNENAYQRKWPLKLAFCCLIPATHGGETPIADMRDVTAAIGNELVNKFERLGVRYIRHYRPFLDIPWEVAFQTNDRIELAKFCREHGIDHEWLDTDTLRTSQVSQGAVNHPLTQERFIFNQAHLFHVSSLGADNAKSLIDLLGADGLPRNAFYGDGQEIPLAELSVIRASLKAHSSTFSWQGGDVLLLDNLQVAHGRNPFSGQRSVVASLIEPHSTNFQLSVPAAV